MKHSAALLLSLCFPAIASADVVLPSIISDHMVLQRGVAATIWGWADPGEQVTVVFAGNARKASPDAEGRWQVALPALKAASQGRDLTVKGDNTVVVKDVLVGEVWLAAGQSNMVSGLKQVPADEKAVYSAHQSNNRVRIFKADGKGVRALPNDTAGRWYLCSEQATHLSAVAFFFALELERQLKVPVACVVIANCGSRIEPFLPPAQFAAIGSASTSKAKASGIYNARIAPITSFAIRGAIWYQGESNRGSTDYYECLKALSAGWSGAFRLPNIPLHLVLVAPFDYSRKGVRSSLLADTIWAAQYRAAREIPGVDVAAIHDTDVNIKMIHPRRKKPVGQRLAALALKHQYGLNVVAAGPSFDQAAGKGPAVVVSFRNIDRGLCTKDGKAPTCFELSEDGHTFVAAEAEIKGRQVEVHSKTLKAPKFVRMGWYDTATPTLRDKNGWPVFAFQARVRLAGRPDRRP